MSFENGLRYAAAAAALVATGPLLAGCGNQAPKAKSEGCHVYDQDGKEVHPMSYTVGKTTVTYALRASLPDETSTAQVLDGQGKIVDNGRYVLHLQHLPAASQLAPLAGFGGKAPYFEVNDGTGNRDGLTLGCVSTLAPLNSLKSDLIHLPTN